MPDEISQESNVAEEVAAQPDPTQEQVEAPNAETEAAAEEKPAQTERVFTQAEVEAIAAKERAIAERKADKRYIKMLEDRKANEAVQPPKQAQEAPSSKPLLADYKTAEEWEDATYQWRKSSEALEHQKQEAAQHYKTMHEKVSKIFDDAEKNNPEFDRETFNALPNVPDAMTYAIVHSDVAEKLVVHLANNPKEADRIASLHPSRQAAEIGKLEVKLSSAPEITASKVPPPPRLPGVRGGSTTKNPADMPQAEYEAHRAKQGASWARR